MKRLKMKFSISDIIGFIIIIFIISFNVMLIVNDIKAKDFCISIGFDKGYNDKLVFFTEPDTVACYNVCFTEDEGTHSCNKKFLIYGG